MKKQPSIHSQDNLFVTANKQKNFETSPLSLRMRPRTLDEYVGQRHILEKDMLLSRLIRSDRLTSLIFYGPPGTGKTTLAFCISNQTKSAFEKVNAVSSNVSDLRKIISESQKRREMMQQKTVLFIDEIHRFNKAQQDVLMPDIEEGNLILIGATTENPFFALNSPLLSRSTVFELESLSNEEVIFIMRSALKDKERGLAKWNVVIEEDVLQFLAEMSDGDARRALNALEIGVMTTESSKDQKIHFSMDVAQESIQRKQVVYDKDGDAHYDVASAFQKSMRGSDPDATLYWLAKMIYAGEDLRFIARRICVCAAEDVGLADPRALILASSALQVSEFIGLPEARIPLAQAALYVASAPKSNATIKGIDQALDAVKNKKMQSVPTHLRDAHYKGAKKLNHGQGYKYAHNYDENYVEQEYMNQKMTFFNPGNLGYEQAIKERLDHLKSDLQKKSS